MEISDLLGVHSVPGRVVPAGNAPSRTVMAMNHLLQAVGVESGSESDDSEAGPDPA